MTERLQSLKSLLSQPTVWFGIAMIAFCFLRFNRQEKLTTIRSDARGYYAHLPAILSHNDATYENSVQAELKNTNSENTPHYLVLSEDGTIYNKYFPGVAVLQLPFYFVATGVSWITGNPADGYSYFYQLFFELGGLFYALLGVFLFAHFLTRLYPKWRKQIQWLVPFVYLATPLFHYAINTLSFSHGYSIALFSLFGILCLRVVQKGDRRSFIYLGLVLGLIFLLRPTNLTVVLVVPFLVCKSNPSISFREFLSHGKVKQWLFLLPGLLGMMALLCILRWWDSGDPFLWSYPDEGFHFSNPHLFETLFSFRTGVFVHAPLLIFAFLAWIVMFRKQPGGNLWWGIYFLVNTWIIGSWWCWDYETAFSHRAFAEHFIFLILPLFALLEKWKYLVYGSIGLFFAIGSVRVYTMYNGSFTNQRFTTENYLPSLLFWKDNHAQRWQFTRSCEPYGKFRKKSLVFQLEDNLKLRENDSLSCGGTVALDPSRNKGRHYFRVQVEKRLQAIPFDDALLVVEATNADLSLKYRYPVPLYNDKMEGLNVWEPLIFEGVIPDNKHEFTSVRMFIVNHAETPIELRKVKMQVLYFRGE